MDFNSYGNSGRDGAESPTPSEPSEEQSPPSASTPTPSSVAALAPAPASRKISRRQQKEANDRGQQWNDQQNGYQSQQSYYPRAHNMPPQQQQHSFPSPGYDLYSYGMVQPGMPGLRPAPIPIPPMPPPMPMPMAMPRPLMPQPSQDVFQMLPRELQREVADSFFQRVSKELPQVHPRTFFTNPEFYKPALRAMVLAFGVRTCRHPFFGDPETVAHWSKIFFEEGRRHVEQAAFAVSPPTDQDLVATLFVASYCSHFGLGSHVAARVTEITYLLAAEVPLFTPRGKSWSQYQEHLRTRWSLWMHDVTMTFGHGFRARPFTVDYRAMRGLEFAQDDWEMFDDVNVPLNYHPRTLESVEANLSSLALVVNEVGQFTIFILLFSIFQSIVSIHNGIPCRDALDTVANRLRVFYDFLPQSCKTIPTAANNVVIVFAMICFHAMMVIVHSPPDLMQMWADEQWLMGPDFLVAAEHADLCTSWIEASTPDVFDFAPSFVKVFVTRVFCMLLMIAQRLIMDPELRPIYTHKVQKHLHLLSVLGRFDKEMAINAKVLSLFSSGRYTGGMPVPQFLASHGFTPEESEILMEKSREYPSPPNGFWAQMRSLCAKVFNLAL